jgi:hypothetical protein
MTVKPSTHTPTPWKQKEKTKGIGCVPKSVDDWRRYCSSLSYRRDPWEEGNKVKVIFMVGTASIRAVPTKKTKEKNAPEDQNLRWRSSKRVNYTEHWKLFIKFLKKRFLMTVPKRRQQKSTAKRDTIQTTKKKTGSHDKKIWSTRRNNPGKGKRARVGNLKFGFRVLDLEIHSNRKTSDDWKDSGGRPRGVSISRPNVYLWKTHRSGETKREKMAREATFFF